MLVEICSRYGLAHRDLRSDCATSQEAGSTPTHKLSIHDLASAAMSLPETVMGTQKNQCLDKSHNCVRGGNVEERLWTHAHRRYAQPGRGMGPRKIGNFADFSPARRHAYHSKLPLGATNQFGDVSKSSYQLLLRMQSLSRLATHDVDGRVSL